MLRSPIGVCAVVGLFVGGYLPVLWGASALGFQSLFLGVVGGGLGIWLGTKVNDFF